MAISVFKKENESLESTLKRFRRAVQEDGVLQTAKRKEFYEKPSQKKQRLIKARDSKKKK